MAYEPIPLSRDCEVVQIPSGLKARLVKDTPVRVTQSLGGAYTVINDYGEMFRINGQDGDAIGREKLGAKFAPGSEKMGREETDAAVWDQLKTCFDPEIPVNVVELGLIYECVLHEVPEGGFHVAIKMTLTAPGCGMGPVLKADVEEKLKAIPSVRGADVEVVFEPPWDQSRMSEAARLQLGFM